MWKDSYRTVGNRSKVCKIWKLLIDVSYHTTLFYLFICLTMFMASGDTSIVYVVVKYITTVQPRVKTTRRKNPNMRVCPWPQHSFSSSYRNAYWSLTHKLHPTDSDIAFCCYVRYSIRGVPCGGHSGSYNTVWVYNRGSAMFAQVSQANTEVMNIKFMITCSLQQRQV